MKLSLTILARENRVVLRQVRNTQNRRIATFLLFLLSPIASLVSSLRNFREPWAKNVLWLFVVFFGYTFVVTGFMDSARYSQRLAEMAEHGVGDVQDLFSLIYQKDKGYVDILEPLVTFTLSRFTSNSRILFAVFGLIFGYFYSRNLWFLFSRVKEKIRAEALPFLVLAALVIAIWQINGFRFWTAAHIFIFGIIHIHRGRVFKGYLFAFLSIFVHFSFVFAFGLALLHLVLGNRVMVLYVLYFVSFFISEIKPEAIRGYAAFVPDVFQERADGYTNEEYREGIEKTYETANWYVTMRYIALRYSLNLVLLFIFYRYRKSLISDRTISGLVCFALLLASAVNLVKSVPSMLRFQFVSDFIMFSALFLLIQSFDRRVLPLMVRLPFWCAAGLYIIVEIRIGFETTSLLAILGNPLVAPFLPNALPLISFFK